MDNYFKQISILYVEDEDFVREGYEKTLSRYSKELFLARDGVEGLELYKQHNPDVVISDIKMPNKNGIEMVREIRAINPEQNVIFTTAHTETSYLLDALDLQVEGYILKPVDKRKLKAKLYFIAKNIISQRENDKNQQLLQNILDNQSSLTLVTDFENIEFASVSFLKMMGVEDVSRFTDTYERLLNIFIHHKDYVFGDNKDEILNLYYNTQNEKRVVSISTTEGVKAFFISIDKIKTLNEIYVISLTDITYLQQEKLKAQYKATHDELTGVYNRSKFEELFDIEYLRALRYNRPVSVAILDIDFFKKVNDTYGHLIGDEILKKMSKFCSRGVRQTDIFCRWGGEEFVLLMIETDGVQAQEVCEHVRRGIKSMKFPNLPEITISIGVTQIKLEDEKDDVFKRADEALYEAKESGRNRVIRK